MISATEALDPPSRLDVLQRAHFLPSRPPAVMSNGSRLWTSMTWIAGSTVSRLASSCCRKTTVSRGWNDPRPIKGFKIFADRHGRMRCYRRKTGAAIDLGRTPLGSAEFLAECARLAASAPAVRAEAKPGTLGLIQH